MVPCEFRLVAFIAKHAATQPLCTGESSGVRHFSAISRAYEDPWDFTAGDRRIVEIDRSGAPAAAEPREHVAAGVSRQIGAH